MHLTFVLLKMKNDERQPDPVLDITEALDVSSRVVVVTRAT